MSHKIYVSFYITIGVVPKWFKGPVCKTVIRRFESGRRLIFEKLIAWVVELVDTADLKSVVRKDVPVRVRPRVLVKKPHLPWGFFAIYPIFKFWHIMAYYGICWCDIVWWKFLSHQLALPNDFIFLFGYAFIFEALEWNSKKKSLKYFFW